MLDIYKTCKNLHAKLYVRSQSIIDNIPKVGTPKRLTDLAYVLDKSIEYLEDTIRQLKKAREEINKPGFIMYVESAGEPLKGVYASGVGKPGKSVNIPSLSKDPAGYQRLCEIFGAPFHPLTRLHYPAFKEHIAAILAKGENLPPELEEFKQYDIPLLVVKGRADNEIDEHAENVPGILGE
jgi:hypothetical protein